MVIIGSVREGRMAETVAKWAVKHLEHEGIELDIADLKDIELPFFNEATHPVVANGKYKNKVATAWAKRVAETDAFIMITAEYNHAPTAVLKNAIDWVAQGWYHKPVGFISYGGIAGGTRAVQQLKQILLEVRMYPVHDNVHIPFVRDAFDEKGNPVREGLDDNLEALSKEITDLYYQLKAGKEAIVYT
jgi:NAD(P)H-dependent FMN reductase